MMYGHEKSDHAIVAVKPTNKAERSAAELVERRAGTEANASQLRTYRTPSRVSVTQDVGSSTASTCRRYPGGSRMRESRTYGSGRGARGNSRPYREHPFGPPVDEEQPKQKEVREELMKSERDGITQRPSQAEQVASNAWLWADGGCIFADAPNAVTSAAVIVHQISMHRNITPLRVTR
jgi:hypothetical protein